MRPILPFASSSLLLLMIAACAPTPAPQPAPPPPPVTAPAPRLSANWQEWPVAPGDWSYRRVDGGSLASYGAPGAAAQLTIRCETTSHSLTVSRAASGAPEQIVGQMTVHTSYGDAQWPVMAGQMPGAATPYAVATRAAIDTTFDRIAFSRGRFAIEAPGTRPISIPAWAEVSRVIEDCRG